MIFVCVAAYGSSLNSIAYELYFVDARNSFEMETLIFMTWKCNENPQYHSYRSGVNVKITQNAVTMIQKRHIYCWKKCIYLSFSRGQFNQPVVMQKYVSCGATWWMRWCRRGKITWLSCRNSTHFGNPKYVCDHLCIYLC